MKSDAAHFPVFVREGGIVPMLAERKGNSTDFDELEVRVYKGYGEYTMYDETGSIKFATETNGAVTRFVIKPSSDCKTKRIKVRFCSLKRARYSAAEVLSADGNAIEVPCRDMEILAEEIPAEKPAEE